MRKEHLFIGLWVTYRKGNLRKRGRTWLLYKKTMSRAAVSVFAKNKNSKMKISAKKLNDICCFRKGITALLAVE